ncbi:MFS transporter [Nocardioides sp.]|uniref:MFS transporter n=1 Tax=Nocardioides sp. TaxID=35761 RepID=UPI003569CFFF
MSPSGAPVAAHAHDVVAIQRRTLRVLVLAQMVGASGMTIGIATASLLARDLSGSETQAGLAQTFQVLGAAAASFLLGRLMGSCGRRVGLATGYLIGAAGAALAVVAGAVGSMALLLVGATLLGATSAANYGSRYTATDLSPVLQRGRALSVVVWATTVGAVAGPNLTGPAGALARWLGVPALTGPFAVGALAMLASALVIALLLRPDPLLVAREVAGTHLDPPSGTSWGRAEHAVRTCPGLGYAIAGVAAAHAAMVAVMVMTPLHMEHGGAELRVIGFVISVHVLGMFAFAPVVGWLCDRYGRSPVLGSGGVVLLVSLLLAHASPEGSSWQIFVGLFLLGLGWSLATVAGSTLIADLAPLEARTDVQGVADMTMNLSAAVGAGLAGLIVAVAGYGGLAFAAVALVAVVFVAARGAGKVAA